MAFSRCVVLLPAASVTSPTHTLFNLVIMGPPLWRGGWAFSKPFLVPALVVQYILTTSIGKEVGVITDPYRMGEETRAPGGEEACLRE